MAAVFDVGIVGCGAMGASAAWELAQRRGADGRPLKVIAWERFDIPHRRGSSHGHSRIIRLSYPEDPGYVPLARRAYERWRALEEESGEHVLFITGGIDAGPPGSAVVQGALESCREHGLEHELLTAAQVNARFPGFKFAPDYEAVWQPDAGFLDPEACISAFVNGALAHGAEIRARELVQRWRRDESGIFHVSTDKDEYLARKLVVAVGAWTQAMCDKLLPPGVTVQPERQVLGWFAPRAGRERFFRREVFPIFIIDDGESGALYYGFPQYKVPGVKLGLFGHFGETANPDENAPEPTQRDEAALRRCLERHAPDAAHTTMTMAACMFCNTVDHHFILDTLEPGVLLAAGFSGHGFKFASAIGELIADWTCEKPWAAPHAKFATQKFSLGRFRDGGAELTKTRIGTQKANL